MGTMCAFDALLIDEAIINVARVVRHQSLHAAMAGISTQSNLEDVASPTDMEVTAAVAAAGRTRDAAAVVNACEESSQPAAGRDVDVGVASNSQITVLRHQFIAAQLAGNGAHCAACRRL